MKTLKSFLVSALSISRGVSIQADDLTVFAAASLKDSFDHYRACRATLLRTFVLMLIVAWAFALFTGCDKKSTGTDRASQAQQIVTVAAASDLKFALDEIVIEFQRARPDIKVQVSYGSSGNFYSQLSQRAPFDMFFSADVSYPARLIDTGFAVADSKFIYAIGRIVVWVPNNSPLDLATLRIESLNHPSVRKIAIANPEHAPYGKAAVAAMQKFGVYDSLKERLIYGENIAQTAQFIESGSVDIGIIALSLAVAPALKDKGRYWLIPLDAYPRMEQGGVILSWAKRPKAVQELRAFILSASSKIVLRRYGFVMPNE